MVTHKVIRLNGVHTVARIVHSDSGKTLAERMNMLQSYADLWATAKEPKEQDVRAFGLSYWAIDAVAAVQTDPHNLPDDEQEFQRKELRKDLIQWNMRHNTGALLTPEQVESIANFLREHDWRVV